MGVIHLLLGARCVYNDSPMIFEAKKAGKFSLLLLGCLLFRLLPLRVPNVEPILASAMPLSKAFGALAGFFFGALSILLYDFVTGTLGVHTFFTASAYGLVGLGAGWYFQGREASVSNFISFAIAGTLFFDAATGLLIGPLFYGQPFAAALLGQIPFTALHLLGNIVFAVTLSPFIHYLLIKKRKPVAILLEPSPLVLK